MHACSPFPSLLLPTRPPPGAGLQWASGRTPDLKPEPEQYFLLPSGVPGVSSLQQQSWSAPPASPAPVPPAWVLSVPRVLSRALRLLFSSQEPGFPFEEESDFPSVLMSLGFLLLTGEPDSKDRD